MLFKVAGTAQVSSTSLSAETTAMVSNKYLIIGKQVIAVFLTEKVTMVTVQAVKNTPYFSFKWLSQKIKLGDPHFYYVIFSDTTFFQAQKIVGNQC